MTLPDRTEILALLRRLDDPVHLEHPAGFDHAAEERRFGSLVAELERRFACTCEVETGVYVQDSSYLGHIVVPASATVEGVAVFVRVSNFGGLALLGAEGPGAYDDDETRYLIADPDWRTLVEVVTAVGCVPLLEDALPVDYDGTSTALLTSYEPYYRPSWFIRYFDYL